MKPEPTDSVHVVSIDAVDTLTRADRPRTTDPDLRRGRILELEKQSLQNDDALKGCLGAQNSGLLRIGLRVERALEAAVGRAGDNLDEIIKLKPGFDIFGAITRQVDRFANLDIRLGESKRQREQNLKRNRAGRRNLSAQRRRIPKN